MLVITGETVAAMRRAPLAEGSDIVSGWGARFSQIISWTATGLVNML